MKIPIDTTIFPQLKGVYIVGGSIRDLMCGRTPIDYDLAVQPDAEMFARRLASRTSGHIVEMGRPGQKMQRVVTKDHFFDILPINGEAIEEDLRQRDFTINAMAVEVASGSLIDQLGGKQDLSKKKIRMVAGDVFCKDPVRLIRAYRLAAAFNFNIDEHTQAAITRDADLIRQSAAERIREEFFKILQCEKSHGYLSRMAQCGLLFSVFPELKELKNYRSSGNDAGDLFEQTLNSYFYLEKLLDPADSIHVATDPQFYRASNTSRTTLIKWAVLFHDIGRPVAPRSVSAGKSVHYCAHAAISAVIAKKICHRLRFSSRQASTIESIIRHHSQPFYLFKVAQKKASIQKAFIRFFMRCGDITPDILVHALAVFRGRRSTGHPEIQKFSDFVSELMQTYTSVLRPRSSLPSPINGDVLIAEFGLAPSPLFQRILRLVEEERLARDVLTRSEAIKLVESLLKQQK